jgi:peptidoglycan/xylan/chitin deacetylase (PgdA/CDA1 family)
MNRIWRLGSLLTRNLIRTHGPAEGGAIYLTFDDGPDPVHTEPLLDLLARHDARATFFLIGDRAAVAPAVVERIRSEGHAIGNHSMTHPRMRRLGLRAQLRQIDEGDAALQRIDGLRRHAFRPPNGKVTVSILLALLWRRHPLLLWSLDSQDYRLDPEAVVTRLRTAPPAAGDILLFHDDAECALRALAVLLPDWQRAGLRFLPLDCDV